MKILRFNKVDACLVIRRVRPGLQSGSLSDKNPTAIDLTEGLQGKNQYL